MFRSRIRVIWKAATANAGAIVIPVTAAATSVAFFPASNPTMMKTTSKSLYKAQRHKSDLELPLITMKELQKHTDMDSLLSQKVQRVIPSSQSAIPSKSNLGLNYPCYPWNSNYGLFRSPR